MHVELGNLVELSTDDRDKIELLQMALHNDFDNRCVAAQDRAFELRSALRARAIRRPSPSPSRKPSAGNPRYHSIPLGIPSRRSAGEWNGHPS
ncbi:hypothetical protein E4U46_005365 [Claviceps purpurea]|nr:hypothetical protein E4U46_005365 [Claviceps purpurea]